MKKALSIIFLFAIVFSACERDNYAALIEKERQNIQQYIKKNYPTVYRYDKFQNVFFFNKDSVKKDEVCYHVTPEGEIYSLGEDSIYFRIIEVGVTTQPVKLFDRVQVRYKEATLDGMRIEDYWSTLDLLHPVEVIFGDIPITGSEQTRANCAGWQSAIAMMQYSETVAEIIVPSKLSLYRNYESVTPCIYRFSFRVVPR